MSRIDLTLIDKISVLDKIYAQPHNSVRELDKLIVVERLGQKAWKTFKANFINC